MTHGKRRGTLILDNKSEMRTYIEMLLDLDIGKSENCKGVARHSERQLGNNPQRQKGI